MVRIVIIDAGHSKPNGDPGAVSGTFIEYDLNCIAAKSCANYLTENYDCIAIVDTDNTIGANCRTAKEKGAAAFISIHHNAGGGDGGEIYYYPGDARAKALAACVAEEFDAIGQNAHGDILKASSKFGVCRNNSINGIPAILGEFAFVDSVKDRIIINTKEKVEAEGIAYAKGAASFLNLPKKVKPVAEFIAKRRIKILSYPSALRGKLIGWHEEGSTVDVYALKNNWGKIADGQFSNFTTLNSQRIK